MDCALINRTWGILENDKSAAYGPLFSYAEFEVTSSILEAYVIAIMSYITIALVLYISPVSVLMLISFSTDILPT